MTLRIDRLTPEDLPGALRLSTEAGWNQTAADWRRLLALAPDGCFAGRLDGVLVATATAVRYPLPDRPAAAPALTQATWIGMVLVARAVRRRGFGTALLKAALQSGLAGGVAPVGLDATDLGRPVYLAQGFVDVAPIDRWLGTLVPLPVVPGPALTVEPLGACIPDDGLAFDRQACGLDRAGLLARLAASPGAAAWTARQGSAVVGLAFLRAGREHFHLGPVVAERSDVLGALLDTAGRHLGGRTVLVDTPRTALTEGALAARGLSVHRRLTRMTYPRPQGILFAARVAAATAFEWG
jgi:GNAT superfamily N-acetyltransferase